MDIYKILVLASFFVQPAFCLVGFVILTKYRLSSIEKDVDYLKQQNNCLIRLDEKVNGIASKQEELLSIIKTFAEKS